MARYDDCIGRLNQAAGRELTPEEIEAVYARIAKAAKDIKAGRNADGSQMELGLGGGPAEEAKTLIQKAAERAAAELQAEADKTERQANLQIIRLGARQGDFRMLRDAGLPFVDAVRLLFTRDYTGKYDIESVEQKATGLRDYYKAKLLPAWDALGFDYLGFFQDPEKLTLLLKEMRGEDTGNAMAKKGAEAWKKVAEEARQEFNDAGGDIGKLDVWGFPQHHSQEKVARAGKEEWIDAILPMLDRERYQNDLGEGWDDARMKEFLGKAWDTIATNGHANIVPGEPAGFGKRANRHGEERQIHFSSAENVLKYWETFGDRTALEILQGHIDTMAKDIAFIEKLGPNPNLTYATIRDEALRDASIADPVHTKKLEGQFARLDSQYDYWAGRSIPTYNPTISMVAQTLSNLNVAGKLGGAVWASFFGDKPMMEAVSHLNDLPLIQRWRNEVSLLNPVNTGDRRLLQTQGLMLESVRSGLLRFNETLGGSSLTGRLANAVMRVSGMQAINDIRKGAFGLSLMSAIGNQIADGVKFGELKDSDIRTLRNYGITEGDYKTWQLATLMDYGGGNSKVLSPEGIAQITDQALKDAGIIAADANAEIAAAARRDATVKLLGAVNTETEFAVVTPGWRERSQFYANLQRGTVGGEIAAAVLQFKAFPWAQFKRGMDAVANVDGPASKAVMTAYLVTATTLAGAMLMQMRDLLSGKDPRNMYADGAYNKFKFWGAALIQGGALGIYGDFLYSANQTRYGSGILEAMAGPTIGPLLSMFAVQPLQAARQTMEGKPNHLAAQTLQQAKGFVPGGNLWFTKTGLDHLVWQRTMEHLSPGYLQNIRAKTMREYGQSMWWEPGASAPDRFPNLTAAAPELFRKIGVGQ